MSRADKQDNEMWYIIYVNWLDDRITCLPSNLSQIVYVGIMALSLKVAHLHYGRGWFAWYKW